MPSLNKDQVRHIAKLARLRLTDEEVEKFAPQLTSILQYVDMLQEVDTKNVEATAHVTGLTNMFRDDVVADQSVEPEQLIATSPLPVVDRQIMTPSAHE